MFKINGYFLIRKEKWKTLDMSGVYYDYVLKMKRIINIIQIKKCYNNIYLEE